MSKIAFGKLKERLNIASQFEDVEYAGIIVQVKNYLLPQEQIDFVETVVAYCSSAGEKWQAVFDTAVRFAFFDVFTNIKLPANMNRAAEFVYGTDCYDMLREKCPDSAKAMNLLQQTAENYLTALYGPYYQSEMDKLLVKAGEFLDGMSDAMKGLDVESLGEMAKKMSGMEPNDIMQAVVDAKFADK